MSSPRSEDMYIELTKEMLPTDAGGSDGQRYYYRWAVLREPDKLAPEHPDRRVLYYGKASTEFEALIHARRAATNHNSVLGYGTQRFPVEQL